LKEAAEAMLIEDDILRLWCQFGQNVRVPVWTQPVDATHYDLSNQRSVADEAKTSDPLHGEPEGADVGALAEG
jgi:hypothetical protein